MNFDINDLYIGTVGIARSHGFRIYLKKEKIAIVKQHSKDHYIDVIEDKKYLDFYHEDCQDNCIGIDGPDKFRKVTSLHTYFLKNYTKIKNNIIISDIVKKIINYEPLTYEEIKKLDCYLNNKKLFKELYLNDDKNKKKKKMNEKSNYNNTLNEKVEQPIVFSDDLNKVILNLAEERKNLILIGNIGVGKTTLVKGLSYKIQKNEVPNFIKGKKIIDITETLKKHGNIDIKKIIKDSNIVLIRDIYSIFNNDSDNNYYDIEMAIKNGELKVIGISNDKNNSFVSDSLNNAFNKIIIDEPNDEMLYEIIDKVFNYYSKKNNINLCDNMDSIINLLIELTNIKNRLCCKDININSINKVCNPELVIEIIDKIFASAKVNNCKKLTIDNIIYGIESCNKINDDAKKFAISSLNSTEKQIYKDKIYF